MLDQNWIINFFRSIGCPIGTTSKIYDNNQAKIKIVVVEIITPQVGTLNFLITDIHEIHLQKTFEMVDTRSNMQLVELNSNPHSGKILRDIID